MYLKSVILLSGIIFHSVSAQPGDYVLGARTSGMGGACTALADPFSVFNNVGGAAIPENSTLVFSIKNLYGLEGMFVLGAAWNQKIREGTFIASVYRFGDHLFSEHKIGIGYSHKIRFVSLGIQVNYLQQSLESSGTSGTLLIEAGGMVVILKGLTFGALIRNPNRARIGRTDPEYLPVIMKAGLAYAPDDLTTICLDILRDKIHCNRIGIGLEYNLKRVFPLRAGAVFNPSGMSAGFGIHLKRFKLDYGAELDPRLGITSQFSVIFQFFQQ
jgi:hypothetical protein